MASQGAGSVYSPIVISDDEDEAYVEQVLSRESDQSSEPVSSNPSVNGHTEYTAIPVTPMHVDNGTKRKWIVDEHINDVASTSTLTPMVTEDTPTKKQSKKRKRSENQTTRPPHRRKIPSLPGKPVNLMSILPNVSDLAVPAPFVPTWKFPDSAPVWPATMPSMFPTSSRPDSFTLTTTQSYLSNSEMAPTRFPLIPPKKTAGMSPDHPTMAVVKKTIGMPPDPDPHSKRGLFIVGAHPKSKSLATRPPNPARTLVMELLPKKFRNIGFVQEWAARFGTLHSGRIEVDAKAGKALIEFANAELARTAFASPRLIGGEGREHVRVWWYRVDGIGADAGVGEIEEGEIEEADPIEKVELKMLSMSKPKKKSKAAKQKEAKRAAAATASASREQNQHRSPLMKAQEDIHVSWNNMPSQAPSFQPVPPSLPSKMFLPTIPPHPLPPFPPNLSLSQRLFTPPLASLPPLPPRFPATSYTSLPPPPTSLPQQPTPLAQLHPSPPTVSLPLPTSTLPPPAVQRLGNGSALPSSPPLRERARSLTPTINQGSRTDPITLEDEAMDLGTDDGYDVAVGPAMEDTASFHDDQSIASSRPGSPSPEHAIFTMDFDEPSMNVTNHPDAADVKMEIETPDGHVSYTTFQPGVSDSTISSETPVFTMDDPAPLIHISPERSTFHSGTTETRASSVRAPIPRLPNYSLHPPTVPSQASASHPASLTLGSLSSRSSLSPLLTPALSPPVSTPTPPSDIPSEPRAMKNAPKGPSYNKRHLLAKHKELEERILRSRMELAAHAEGSGTQTPVEVAQSVADKAAIDAAMELNLRRLVLEGKRAKQLASVLSSPKIEAVVTPTIPDECSGTSTPTDRSSPATTSTNTDTAPATLQPETPENENTSSLNGDAVAFMPKLASFSQPAASENSVNLDDLAVSFITETLQTAQLPRSKPPLSENTDGVANAPIEAPQTAESLAPDAKPTSELSLLEAKRKRLEQHIAESKILMARLNTARTKQERESIFAALRDRGREMEEDMKTNGITANVSNSKPPLSAIQSSDGYQTRQQHTLPYRTRWPATAHDAGILVVSDDEDSDR